MASQTGSLSTWRPTSKRQRLGPAIQLATGLQLLLSVRVALSHQLHRAAALRFYLNQTMCQITSRSAGAFKQPELEKLQILPALSEEDLTHEVRRGIGRRRNMVVNLLVLESFVSFRFERLAAGSCAM